MILRKKKFIFILSCLGHLILLLGVSLFIIKEEKPQLEINNFLPAYVQPQEKKLITKNLISKHAIKPKINTTNKPRFTQSKEIFTIKTQETNFLPLLAILHSAIAREQIYPEEAAELSQSGTVKIGFLLFPNGIIQNLTILRSSGVNALDNEALAAINRATPIHGVSNYLKNPTFLDIEVIFKND